MKKQIIKEFVVVKKVRHLPRLQPQVSPPPAPVPAKRIILVVGRCVMNIITICHTHPMPGTEVRNAKGYFERGGKASQLCTVLRRLGVAVEFLALLCNAPGFESIVDSLHGMNIDISHCPRVARPPPMQSFILVEGTNIKTKIGSSNRGSDLTYQHFRGAVDFQKYHWIHFESCNPTQTLRMMRSVREFNERVPEASITMSINLNNLGTMSALMACLADFVFVKRHLMDEMAYMNGHETVWKVRDTLNVVQAKWKAKQRKKMPYIMPDEPPVGEEPCELKPDAPVIIYSNYQEGSSCLLADDTYFKVDAHKPAALVNMICEDEAFIGGVIYAYSEVKMSLRDAIEYGTRVASAKLAMHSLDELRCMPKNLAGFN